MEEALEALLKKYGIAVDKRFVIGQGEGIRDIDRLRPGYELTGLAEGINDVPLLYWRLRRSFIELKNVAIEGVIGQVCLQKSRIISSRNRWSFRDVIYREADICEYIGEGVVKSVFAVRNGEHGVNVIARLDTGVLCSMEISLDMPDRMDSQEMHEIVGRGGVASDRAIDAQLVQDSLYCFTRSADSKYTDTDAELFGFDPIEVEQIRSAFEIYKDPDLRERWIIQHRHLLKVVEAVVVSAEECRKVLID